MYSLAKINFSPMKRFTNALLPKSFSAEIRRFQAMVIPLTHMGAANANFDKKSDLRRLLRESPYLNCCHNPEEAYNILSSNNDYGDLDCL